MPSSVTVGTIGSQIASNIGTPENPEVPTSGGTVPGNHTLVRSFVPVTTGNHVITIKNNRQAAIQFVVYRGTTISNIIPVGSKQGSSEVVQLTVSLEAGVKHFISVDSSAALKKTMLRIEGPTLLTQTCPTPQIVSSLPSPGYVTLNTPGSGVEHWWRLAGSSDEWKAYVAGQDYVGDGVSIEVIAVGPGKCETSLVTGQTFFSL